MNKIRHNFSLGTSLQNRTNNRLLNIDEELGQILGTDALRDDASSITSGASLFADFMPFLAATPAPANTPSIAAQTNPVSAPTPVAQVGAYHSLAGGNFTQDWSDAGLITVNDDWSGVPSIAGFLGDTNAGTPTGVDPQTLTANDASAIDVVANQTSAGITNGGVAEFTGAGVGNNNTIALQGSGTADSPYIVIYLDSTGRENITFAANIRDLDASTDNAVQSIAVQYRTGPTGTWINLPAGYVADATSGPGLATLVTAINVTLPVEANNQAQLQIRVMTANAAGNDEWVGIDDISVASFPAAATPGALAINDVALAEGNAGATDYTFTVTRSGGSAGAVSATWTLATDGNADAADFTTTPQTGTVNFADGQTTATVTISVAGDTVVEGNETFFVNLTAPTGGATISDAQGLGTINNDDSPPVGTLSINDVSIAEGNAGTTALVFTVTRSAGSFGAVAATWTVANGTTNAADFAGALTGTVSFADGETSATITVDVAGDTVFENNETFTVTLSAPTGGATITDASGIGTITNDDAAPAVANVWINEFNYDPVGTDANEFIEIAGIAGTDLTGWSLVLYNGNGGAVYGTLNLSGTLTDTSNGFGFVKVLAPGLQNGAPDGFALVDNLGRVVQFLSYEGPMTATAGAATGMTSTDVGVEQANAALGFTLQLTGTGSGYAGFTWTADVANTEGAVNAGQTFLSGTDQGQISIRDASVTEGNTGTANLTFTVSRAGGFASSATVDYQVLLTGTANAADLDAAAVLSGTVTFAANEFTRTITVTVAGDVVGEANETLLVQLSNVTGNAVIADGSATGTIINDDPVPLTIMEIQGASHTSSVAGQVVLTGGIVTAVDTDGFYMQHATGDGNAATSDGIFVFTTSAPTVVVGDAVSISGTVEEFLPGANTQNLTVTRIVPTSVVIDSSGNPLPAAVIIGTGGILPPTEAYDSDGFTIFNPTVDGLDFYESLEGMRITIDAPLVVGPTNSFGETTVVASGGVGATGVNSRGGVTISAGDFNPERIQIDDDSGLFAGYVPNYTQGDRLSSVTGVVGYNFTTYEVLVTEAVTVTTDAPALTRNPTTLVGDADHLSMATYNVSNLDPTDTTFNLLATDIVFALGAPDILAVQEIQDADGAGTGSNLSGTVTAQLLINAIAAAGGPTYVYVEVAPTTANTTGGEPNGNIRNGYFYNPDRVSYIANSATAIDSATYSGTRRPLAAQFVFNGQTILAIDVHFTSRGGSDPLTGSTQPPSNAGDAARTAQADGVAAYINNQLATNPALNVAVLGDFNGFWFEDVVGNIVTNAGLNRASDLAPEEERYSYVFENNAQQIDHILLSDGLFAGAQYDAVHINAEFSAATRPSDHDPQVVLLLIPAPNAAPTNLVISNEDLAENNATNTVVGTVSATDRVGDVLTYSLSDDAGGLFTINPTTGVLTAIAAFDFETLAGYNVVVRVTDQGMLFTELTFTINITDVNEAPTAVANVATVDEDGSSSNLYALLLGNDFDVDSGDTFTISSTGGTALGTVQFDAVAQTLVYVADDDAFDPLRVGESATDSFTYTITDAGGLTHTATVTVTVNGVADAPITQSGTPFDDTLTGADGDDTFNGLAGNDVINGGGGIDILNGDAGNDRLILGSAASGSSIDGGADTDTLVITRNVASLAGLISIEALELNNGAGLTITGTQFANGLAKTTAVSGTGSITVNMDAGVNFLSQNFAFSGSGVTVNVNGTSGTDIIKSGAGVHVINAGDGNDQIRGGTSADIINGGTGDDKIIGNTGADMITGGTGSDQFRYFLASDSGLGAAADVIIDYEIGVDQFNFSLFDTNPVLAGIQGFAFVGNAAFSGGGAAQLRYTNSGADLLVQADIDGDGIADMEIILQGQSGGTLTAADFIL
jgi:predicted extracellular nuclease